MSQYDFTREPLASADIVIQHDSDGGRVCKNNAGQAGGFPTPGQCAIAEDAAPNRRR